MEEKTLRYDGDLHVEAYRFRGYTQPFPLHFHPEYILGRTEGKTLSYLGLALCGPKKQINRLTGSLPLLR